jgi:1,4-alpha-glucan branching enzyme
VTDSLDRRDIEAIVAGEHPDPFAVLGPSGAGSGVTLRAFLPGAENVTVIDGPGGAPLAVLEQIGDTGFFWGRIANREPDLPYRLLAMRGADAWEVDDPYRFGPIIGDIDNYLLGEGSHKRLWERLATRCRSTTSRRFIRTSAS